MCSCFANTQDSPLGEEGGWSVEDIQGYLEL